MRSPPWATLTERRLPWLTSTLFLPSALATPGRSIAMRGGVWIAKPAGTAGSGSDSSTRSTSEPACWLLLIDWIAFCAKAVMHAPSDNASAKARERHLAVI